MRSNKKLRLSKDTLKRLTDEQLGGAGGGGAPQSGACNNSFLSHICTVVLSIFGWCHRR